VCAVGLSGHRIPDAAAGGTFFAATKFAVKALTEGLRQEVRCSGWVFSGFKVKDSLQAQSLRHVLQWRASGFCSGELQADIWCVLVALNLGEEMWPNTPDISVLCIPNTPDVGACIAAAAACCTVQARSKGLPLRVSGISPGLVETNFFTVRAFGDEEAARQVVSSMTCLQPSDVADAVLWCLSAPSHMEVNDIVIRPTEQLI
jgi:hypothetical protein